MRKTLEVVDDFHPNPAALTRRVLHASGSATADPAAPSRGRFVGPRYIDPRTIAAIGDLLGITADRTVPQPDTGRFVLRDHDVPGDDAPRPERVDWMAILFLSPPTLRSDAGLTFWRQRAGAVGPEGWTECAFVPVRFNRLVLYRPSKVRRQASPGFGGGVADGWLSHECGVDLDPTTEGGRSRAQ
ncbi:hypothetical protein [Streptomyces sp. NPDC058953]|uniref:hypothetical protein n=1 Tax=unclassified Streptomyces TaxID=2593676 RepID=UPI0036C72E72